MRDLDGAVRWLRCAAETPEIKGRALAAAMMLAGIILVRGFSDWDLWFVGVFPVYFFTVRCG